MAKSLCSFFGKISLAVSYKLNIHLSYHPAIPFLGIDLQKMKIHVHKN